MNPRNLSVFFIVMFALSSLQLSALPNSSYKFQRQFSVRNTDGKVKVPQQRIWKIEGLRPYESEKGVGTADLYIDGQILVGSDNAYTVQGKFDICINRKQTSALWVLEDSEVQVGDSRDVVTIREYLIP